MSNFVFLKKLCDIKLDFPEADFWLKTRGSITIVGTISEIYNAQYIGIKLVKFNSFTVDDIKNYLRKLQQQGYMSHISTGDIFLFREISTKDVANIKIMID